MKKLTFEEMIQIEGGDMPLPAIDTSCQIAGATAVANNFNPSEYGSVEATIIYNLAYDACFERLGAS